MLPVFVFIGGAVAWAYSQVKRAPANQPILTTLKNSVSSTGALFGPFQPYGPQMPVNKNKLSATELLNLIGQIEGKGNYNIVFGGKTPPLTSMSIKEVYAYQDAMRKSGLRSTAVGKYQFIQKTLKEVVADLKYPETQIFTAQVQDTLALDLLNARGFQNYLNGKLSEASFLKNLAMEWASIPKDSSNKSYYAGDGLNKALVDYKIVLAAMRNAKTTYTA